MHITKRLSVEGPDTRDGYIIVAEDESDTVHAYITRAEADALIAALNPWRDIASAPKGSWLEGPRDTRHVNYVEPPALWLLLKDGQRCVGAADAYCAEGGGGFDGGSYWVESFSGERVAPIRWMPLPPPPVKDKE